MGETLQDITVTKEHFLMFALVKVPLNRRKGIQAGTLDPVETNLKYQVFSSASPQL